MSTQSACIAILLMLRQRTVICRAPTCRDPYWANTWVRPYHEKMPERLYSALRALQRPAELVVVHPPVESSPADAGEPHALGQGRRCSQIRERGKLLLSQVGCVL